MFYLMSMWNNALFKVLWQNSLFIQLLSLTEFVSFNNVNNCVIVSQVNYNRLKIECIEGIVTLLFFRIRTCYRLKFSRDGSTKLKSGNITNIRKKA